MPRKKKKRDRSDLHSWSCSSAEIPSRISLVRRGVLEVRTAAKSNPPPIARFRYPCGLSTEPAAETIRRRNDHQLSEPGCLGSCRGHRGREGWQ